MTAPEPRDPSLDPPRGAALRELAWLFLRLGATAFGGPVAHIALIEDEVVRRRRWLTREELLDLIGAVNLIPGPNSTELAIHIGHRRAGGPGLIVAGACFIAPAMGIVTLLGWAYVRYGALPAVSGILWGIKPVIIAVVLQALWGFARTAIKSLPLAAVGAAALAASLLGVSELPILLGASLLMLLGRAVKQKLDGPAAAALPLALYLQTALPPAAAPLVGAAGALGLWPLFLFFLKVGSLLFGSGYVLLAFLRADLVVRWHWLTQTQLLDAVAVGQFTPGPVFTTATFIGYVLCGLPGALLATVGIFLPAFVFVALSAPLLPRLRRSRHAAAVLDGVNVASLALMLSVTLLLGRSAITSWGTLGMAAASLVLLVRWRLNSAWLVLGGGLLGWLAHRGP
jgi:chromate transporter